MPAVANIVRVVLNSSNGRWYKFERDGDRLIPLPSTGIAITPTSAAPSATNAIHVYRVTNERGLFQTMVASVAHPATLDVYVKDPTTGNLSLKETVSATAFSTDHIEFPLAGDYTADNAKGCQLDFRDGTIGTLEASEETVTLYEKRITDALDKEGTWKIIAAKVTELEDKRVVFESSDPSIVRVERGAVTASTYPKVATDTLQTDQWCVIVGVRVGAATITCRSAIDSTLVDEVAVTVARHPDDPPKPEEGSPADLVEDAFAGIVVGISSAYDHSKDNVISLTQPDNSTIIERRDVVVPGEPEQLFKCTLSYVGTVPKFHEESTYVNTLRLLVGVAGGVRFGAGKGQSPEAYLAEELALDGAVTLNSSGTGTQALDGAIEMYLRGGDVVSFAWVNWTLPNNVWNTNGDAITPAGEYTIEFNLTVDTYHPQQDASA